MTASRTRSLRLAGLLLVLTTLPASPTRAASESDELTGYDTVASGTAVTVSPTVPALLPVEAPIEAILSLATATLSTGGQGYGRASTFFPGTPIAGIRPLIEVASGQRLPLPDYPIVVESREFEHARSDDIPGITMSADVDPDRAVVVADAGGTSIPGLFGVHSARSISTTLLEGRTASASSVAVAEGIDVAGVVQIDTVRSVATARSDAATATCDGEVVVEGVTVNGQAATVDRDGLHVQGDDAGGNPLADALEPDLGASGIEVRTIGGADVCSEGSASRSSSALLIRVPLPEAGSIPAGGKLTILVASAYAAASASTVAPPPPPGDDGPPTLDDVAPFVPGPSTGGGPLQPVALPPITGGSGDGAGDPGPVVADGEPLAYSFGGVPAPFLGGLLLLAIPLGQRIRRYMDLLTGLLST